MTGEVTGVAVAAAVVLATAAVVVHRRWIGDVDDTVSHPRAPAEDGIGRAGTALARRPLLVRAVVALAGVLGLGGMAWLWRYGARPSVDTGWADGVRLVDESGAPLRPADLPPGGIVTVWPEAAGNRELAAVVVLRIPSPASDGLDAGGLVAYSRVCTHAGCPVALFRAEDATLYCPCHQATFDTRRDAEPIFGPASEPLPRLPIGTDADGHLVARGGLSAPPGPRA